MTIKTKLRDHAAVSAACRRLQLPPPILGTAQLFSGQAAGLIVRLTDWTYPAVIDTDDRAGSLRQLRWSLGRPEPPDSLSPDLCRGEGAHRGPQEGPPDHRAVPGRWIDQADNPRRRWLMKMGWLGYAPMTGVNRGNKVPGVPWRFKSRPRNRNWGRKLGFSLARVFAFPRLPI